MKIYGIVQHITGTNRQSGIRVRARGHMGQSITHPDFCSTLVLAAYLLIKNCCDCISVVPLCQLF